MYTCYCKLVSSPDCHPPMVKNSVVILVNIHGACSDIAFPDLVMSNEIAQFIN